jgi:Ca2+-binding RTX toxin-like protein
LQGDDGDDKLIGQVGNDVLRGGEGHDVLIGFTGSNELKQALAAGETDDDTLFGGKGMDNLYGGLGNDTLDGGDDADLVVGNEGNDTLFAGAGNDEVQGGDGHDRVLGEAGDDRLFGQAGNDMLWGGDGNDVMLGFTASNDAKQSLLAGEVDNDTLLGGAGNDLMLGGLGDDRLDGEAGIDELQGGAGHDMLYGGDGNDRLFGQAGDDVLYGGAGDDLILGSTAFNEAAPVLGAGQTDHNRLYGGAGNDAMLGGAGSDYLDGGAGADLMEGGKGDDTYVVNSVNDVILERAGEGHDMVVSSASYLLNNGIEELRLLEGLDIHGTGNALDNRLLGNSRDNILDGVEGKDAMLGGAGNDIYYVDNAGDQVVEFAGEGADTVQASASHTLGANVEKLKLLDFSKPEKGLVDGVATLVYGYPKRNELDYMQGDAVPDYLGTCALTSIANLLTQAQRPTSEGEVVRVAIQNQWAVTDPARPAYERGGSDHLGQQAILDSYGMRNDLLAGYNEEGVANLVRSGRGVMIAVNAGVLWNDPASSGSGAVNHAVTVTGAVYGESDGRLMGFYIADSGRQMVSDMTRFVGIEQFRGAADAPGAYAIYTLEPLKFWNEDIDGHGNALDNEIVGNRGDNRLSGGLGRDTLDGGAGRDTLEGGAGNDVYLFGRGDGVDTIRESDAAAGNIDTVRLDAGITADQLWFERMGDDLALSILGTADRLVIDGWYLGAAQRVEQFQTGDGKLLLDAQANLLAEAMAGFARPAAGETRLSASHQQGGLGTLIAANWQ